jgi:hypothetical protein
MNQPHVKYPSSRVSSRPPAKSRANKLGGGDGTGGRDGTPTRAASAQSTEGVSLLIEPDVGDRDKGEDNGTLY